MARKKTQKKRVVKKKVDKRRVGTSQTKVSRATKKPPSARLKARRKKNTSAGYYPNPITGAYLVIAPTLTGIKKGAKDTMAYWTGTGWDTDRRKGVIFPTQKAAINAGCIIPRALSGGAYYSLSAVSV